MNNNGQGVQYRNRLPGLFTRTLLLFTFLLAQPTHTAASPTNILSGETHNVFVIHSPDNSLHTDIIKNLSDDLTGKRADIIISKVAPETIIETVDPASDIIIGIGSAGMNNANKNYPEINKLFISTDPEKFSIDTETNKRDAVLYMTQSYCRQLQFISLINDKWRVVSILNSAEKPIDKHKLQQCGNKYGIYIYTVTTSTHENITSDIKNAMNHSDLLLALPDKSIYNSRTVKNILLTSYRYRKPVIAFSQNFVGAGALASIHSNVEQIAQSASHLIEQYYKSNHKFKHSINHPQLFDISINRQVFRALDLHLPDTDKLEQTLKQSITDMSEESR